MLRCYSLEPWVILGFSWVSGTLCNARWRPRTPFATIAARLALAPDTPGPRRQNQRAEGEIGQARAGRQPGFSQALFRTLLRKRNRIDGSPPVRRAEFGGCRARSSKREGIP